MDAPVASSEVPHGCISGLLRGPAWMHQWPPVARSHRHLLNKRRSGSVRQGSHRFGPLRKKDCVCHVHCSPAVHGCQECAPVFLRVRMFFFCWAGLLLYISLMHDGCVGCTRGSADGFPPNETTRQRRCVHVPSTGTPTPCAAPPYGSPDGNRVRSTLSCGNEEGAPRGAGGDARPQGPSACAPQIAPPRPPPPNPPPVLRPPAKAPPPPPPSRGPSANG